METIGSQSSEYFGKHMLLWKLDLELFKELINECERVVP